VNALEKASVGEDIAPFADFLAGLVKNDWRASPCRRYRKLRRRRTPKPLQSASG
jgi:hypothetical protein